MIENLVGKWLKSCVYLSYEQIRPQDAFGLIMTQHFSKRNSPLKCIEKYPDLDRHRLRFSDKCQQIYVQTVEEIWKRFVQNHDFPASEIFDEVPEFISKCLHYILIIAAKNIDLNLDHFWSKKPKPTKFELIQVDKVKTLENLER